MTDTPLDPFGPQRAPRPEPKHVPQLDYTSLSLHKIALIAGLAIATILPNLFISNLIEERETRQAGVREEFKRNWGPEQSLYSPVLIIPYQTTLWARHYLKITPTRLDVAAALNPQERKRGLFHVTVYDAKVEMQGTFVVPPEARLRDFITEKDARLLWNEAMIAFGAASNLTGLRATDSITIDGAEQTLLPCLEALRQETPCRGAALVMTNAPLAATGENSTRMSFKTNISLRGTSSFSLQHAGKELSAMVRSPWPSPSFNGTTLPLESSVTPDGFEAKWQTMEFGSPRIASSMGAFDPGMWKGATIGVDLIEATPTYRMINRVAKYGLLFVVLAFATYFFFEVLSRLRIHIVQYGLLGLSLSLFSLLLLSLAEPIGYTAGYLVAAGLVLTQSTLYTAAVARRFLPAFVFALILASLFGFIYVLLGMETYSLLIGALALFVVVSALMVLTQMVKWPGRVEVAPVSA
jgi:inner membrane protein